jgi:hypothetical protein
MKRNFINEMWINRTPDRYYRYVRLTVTAHKREMFMVSAGFKTNHATTDSMVLWNGCLVAIMEQCLTYIEKIL